MDKARDTLWRCGQDLFEAWKRHYGLGTYYEGYLSVDMAKEIMTLRRQGGDYSSLSFKEDVKDKMIATVEKYDLSEAAINDSVWDEFWVYMKQRENERR